MSAPSSMWTTDPPAAPPRRDDWTPYPRTSPTQVNIPRPPRVPTATNWRPVEAVRYDLEHATAIGLASGVTGFCPETAAFYFPNAEVVYGGLTPRESDALCEARVELCEWADRLGRR